MPAIELPAGTPTGERVSPASDPDLGVGAPLPVDRPVMIHRWRRVGFLHRPFEPALVQRLLPPGLHVDTFDGVAWVGIVPFRLEVRLPSWAPAIPWLSATLETNLRTYVRGPDGRRGIFFLYLDAGAPVPVVVARAWYGIPYRWAKLRFERRGTLIRYESLRREPVGAHLDLRIAVSERVRAEELTELERFLICRWRLYSAGTRGHAVTEVEHDPWPVHRAEVAGIDEGVTVAVGLPPGGPALAHYSPGVEARFGRRRALPQVSA